MGSQDHAEHYRFRSELVERLQLDLLGPIDGEDEVLSDAPVTTYSTGILFPRRQTDEHRLNATAEVDVDLTGAELSIDEVPDTGVSMANMQSPSSMGITFAVDPAVSSAVTVS